MEVKIPYGLIISYICVDELCVHSGNDISEINFDIVMPKVEEAERM